MGFEYIYFIAINIKTHLYLGVNAAFRVQREKRLKQKGLEICNINIHACIYSDTYSDHVNPVIQHINEKEARICSVLC